MYFLNKFKTGGGSLHENSYLGIGRGLQSPEYNIMDRNGLAHILFDTENLNQIGYKLVDEPKIREWLI